MSIHSSSPKATPNATQQTVVPVCSAAKAQGPDADAAALDQRKPTSIHPASPNTKSSSASNESEQSSVEHDQVILHSLQNLIANYGAKWITHWITDLNAPRQHGESPSLSSNSNDSDCPATIFEKSKRLAAEAIEKSEVTSQLISSSSRYFIVAAPLPGSEGCGLTVVFPLNRISDSATSNDVSRQRSNMALRCRDVALTAAHISIVKLSAATHKKDAAHQQPEMNVVGAEDEQTETTPSWSALGCTLLRKLRELCASTFSNSRNAILTTIAIVLIGLLPAPFTVTGSVICEPATQRFVAAPFDAKLLESKVFAGEEVQQGQLLAVLDGADIEAESSAVSAQLSQARQRRKAAMNAGEVGKAEIERHEIAKLESQLSILTNRERNLEIRAPMAGVVVAGNLERAKGSPLKMGDPLFEIAPLQNLIAEIAVSESNVSYLKVGDSTRITLDSAAGKSQLATIVRVHPRNEIRD
ncbi:MAG: HlyD family efflux transporter periplasmic adaptor subunit, partial [Planctomycetota bacterium]